MLTPIFIPNYHGVLLARVRDLIVLNNLTPALSVVNSGPRRRAVGYAIWSDTRPHRTRTHRYYWLVCQSSRSARIPGHRGRL